MANPLETAELLDIHVDHLAGRLALIAPHRLRGLKVFQSRQPGAFQEAVGIGVGQVELHHLDTVHLAFAAAPAERALQAGLTTMVGAAHHGDLMPFHQQPTRHLIGTGARGACWGREMLMEIQNLHVGNSNSVVNTPASSSTTSSTGSGVFWL